MINVVRLSLKGTFFMNKQDARHSHVQTKVWFGQKHFNKRLIMYQ